MCSCFNNWNRINVFLFLILPVHSPSHFLSICLVRCTTSFLSQKRIYANMFIRLKTVQMPSHAVLSKHFMLRNRTIINWIIICYMHQSIIPDTSIVRIRNEEMDWHGWFSSFNKFTDFRINYKQNVYIS